MAGQQFPEYTGQYKISGGQNYNDTSMLSGTDTVKQRCYNHIPYPWKDLGSGYGIFILFHLLLIRTQNDSEEGENLFMGSPLCCVRKGGRKA